MRASIRAARDEVAHGRIVEAVATLCDRVGISFDVNALTVHSRDPAVRAMYEREALADVLEALTDTPEPTSGDLVSLAELDNVEGVGPATLKKIREHFLSGSQDDVQRGDVQDASPHASRRIG